MKIRSITTAAGHAAALQAIDGLMSAELRTPQGDHLEVLTTLVQAYEAKHFPMELPNPIDAIKFKMEQKGLMP